MVRAILDGRKTQTRRVMKNPEYMGCFTGDCPHWKDSECVEFIAKWAAERCPYGQPGDRIWVRETWSNDTWIAGPERMFVRHCKSVREGERIIYRADDHEAQGIQIDDSITWRPSIYMPRWASRLTLEVTGVRVERLQEISKADCRAEGVIVPVECTMRDGFALVWDSLNATRAPWASNPWVWVVEFKRV
jgi:hypothetical protein